MTPADLEAHRAAAFARFAQAHSNLISLFGSPSEVWEEARSARDAAQEALANARLAHETALKSAGGNP